MPFRWVRTKVREHERNRAESLGKRWGRQSRFVRYHRSMPADLRSPKLKLQRARSLIRDAEAALRPYVMAKPYSVHTVEDRQSRQTILKFTVLKEVSEEALTIIADAVHNL